MDKVKTVALVAHDNRKSDLTEWVAYNANKLAKHHLVCTGTTGRMVEETLARSDQAPQSLTKLKYEKTLKDYSQYINRIWD